MRNIVALFNALGFFLVQEIVRLLRWVHKISHLIFFESLMVIKHSFIWKKVIYYQRVYRVGGRQRLPLNYLLFAFRPQYNDMLWLCVLLGVGMISAIQHFYPGGITAFSHRFSIFYADTLVSEPMDGSLMNSTISTHETNRQIHVQHNIYQPIISIWQDRGIEVENEYALSNAFQALILNPEFDSLQTTVNPAFQKIPVSVSLQKKRDQGYGWRLSELRLSLSKQLSLQLTPERNIVGEVVLSPKVVFNAPPRTRFVIQGTINALIAEGYQKQLLAHQQPYEQTGYNAVMGNDSFALEKNKPIPLAKLPTYLEDLLIFLDRAQTEIGATNRSRLDPQDFVSALYRQESKESEPQLLYVELSNNGQQSQYTYFQQSLDDKGYLYDEGGLAYEAGQWGEPLVSAQKTSGFGFRQHPVKKYNKFHHGIDYRAPIGTPIRATKDGIVLQIRYNANGFGHYVRLLHEDGFSTLYAHMKKTHPNLKQGYPVQKGAVIGFLGNSGVSTGPHLHYEVALNGQTIDPELVTLGDFRLLSPSQRKKMQLVQKQRKALLDELKRVEFNARK